MTDIYQCGDNGTLVSYVYDECTAAERAAIEAHLAYCAACAAELGALGSTRTHLASWTPPESELGFQIVKRQTLGPRLAANAAAPAAPSIRWWNRSMPAWAQVAAAALIFATGLTLGVTREPAGDATAGRAVTAAASPAANVSSDDLAALEQRLRAEIAQAQTPAPAAATARSFVPDSQMLSQVRALVEDRVSASEKRQEQQLAFRINQVVTDFETQRRFDLTQLERTLGQFEVTTGAEFRRQQNNVDMLMRVSQPGQGR